MQLIFDDLDCLINCLKEGLSKFLTTFGNYDALDDLDVEAISRKVVAQVQLTYYASVMGREHRDEYQCIVERDNCVNWKINFRCLRLLYRGT